MCVNYVTVKRGSMARFGAPEPQGEWEPEVWQDYAAPIVVADRHGRRHSLLASYGMVPQHRLPAGSAFSTMNARAETVARLRSYREAWTSGQLCLVPMAHYFEPNYESGRHVRWAIGMADEAPFAVAGLWRAWAGPDGRKVCSFTQLTVNADEHPLLRRFHRPGDEKRSLVIVAPDDYARWLACRDPVQAHGMLRLTPAAQLHAFAAPPGGQADPQAALF